MKYVASVLGLGPLLLIIGGSLLFGVLENSAGSVYLAALNSQAEGAQNIVQAALNIAIHLSMTTSNPAEKGAVFTLYNTNDGKASPYPGFDQQKLLQYWRQGGVTLNNVQCAGFVSAALYMANHPMVHPLAFAIQYWNNPQGAFPPSTWQYVLPSSGGVAPPRGIQATRGTPMPGDIAVFKSPDGEGHVAIVVQVNPPASGQRNGTIVLAQANFPPNYYTLDPRRSSWSSPDPAMANPVPWITTPDIPLYVAPLLPDYTVGLLGFPLLGYIRNVAAQQLTLPPVGYGGSTGNLPNSPWVQVAQADAAANGIDPTLFVRQINQESGFNPTVVSPAGAEGIAQFMPSTASSMGVNPWDPASALAGAARMMANSYRHFLSFSSSSQEAYEMALADYNCGCAQATISAYGSAWINYLPAETQNYIRIIMGV